jgi:hypothetical protein
MLECEILPKMRVIEIPLGVSVSVEPDLKYIKVDLGAGFVRLKYVYSFSIFRKVKLYELIHEIKRVEYNGWLYNSFTEKEKAGYLKLTAFTRAEYA